MAPTTGRGADLPAASLQIGPTAYPVFFFFFLRSPKNRALASAYAPFGSGGFQESNDRRSGEMAPRSAETSFQTSFSSPSSASFAPFSFFRESQRHSSVAKNLSASSPRLGFSNFARQARASAAAMFSLAAVGVFDAAAHARVISS